MRTTDGVELDLKKIDRNHWRIKYWLRGQAEGQYFFKGSYEKILKDIERIFGQLIKD